MPEVSWTSDKHKGGVSVLVEPFRTTFVFGINSSGYFLSVPGIIDRQPGGGNIDDRCVRGGVVRVWIAYSYSLYFSDQFSCIKFFDPIYGLKDIDFISLINFKTLKILFYLIIILLIIKSINNSF